MKSGTAGAASGCVIWAILFGILATCLGFAAMMVGGFTAGTDLAARTVGPMVCPDGTTPRVHSYETTSTDDYGNESPATGFEMQCLDRNQKVVKTDPVAFGFYWIGVLAAAGLVLAAVLASLVAGPVGVLVARRMKKNGGPRAD